jgi:hypothetical protein
MLTPVLPYLKNIPGLVGLEINDVAHGFGDQDANALLEIFNTNQGLLNNIINISGMTPATQGPFVKKLQQVIDARKKLFFHTSEGPNALKFVIYHGHSAKG